MAKSRTGSTRRRAPDYTIEGDIGGGPGASDSNSGGGNASGIPDADTALRAPAAARGNAKQDRAKLFPERFASEKPRAAGAGAKGRVTKPLKKHGDKFEDKIPSNTRGRGASAGSKKKRAR